MHKKPTFNFILKPNSTPWFPKIHHTIATKIQLYSLNQSPIFHNKITLNNQNLITNSHIALIPIKKIPKQHTHNNNNIPGRTQTLGLFPEDTRYTQRQHSNKSKNWFLTIQKKNDMTRFKPPNNKESNFTAYIFISKA